MDNKEWKKYIKSLLKQELSKQKITYPVLVEKLKVIGVDESLFSIKNKLSRGTFNAVFFVQCFKAIGCENIGLEN